MVFNIDGVDMLPYVFRGGFQWKREDMDGPGTGRTLDGDLRRNRIATKRRLDIICRPLRTTEAAIVLSAIMPKWVEVQYTDPQAGGSVTKTMYSNNNPASFCMIDRQNVEWWNGITFPLIEK